MDKKRSHVIDGGVSVQFAERHQSDFKKNIDAFWANVNYEKSQGRYSITPEQDADYAKLWAENALLYNK